MSILLMETVKHCCAVRKNVRLCRHGVTGVEPHLSAWKETVGFNFGRVVVQSSREATGRAVVSGSVSLVGTCKGATADFVDLRVLDARRLESRTLFVVKQEQSGCIYGDKKRIDRPVAQRKGQSILDDTPYPDFPGIPGLFCRS